LSGKKPDLLSYQDRDQPGDGDEKIISLKYTIFKSSNICIPSKETPLPKLSPSLTFIGSCHSLPIILGNYFVTN
jgi:hypothetical protein